MILKFNESDHSYTIDGRPAPGVTSVIGAVLPGFQAGDWYKQRGLALHHGCRLLDDGKLKWESVHAAIAGRVKAWEKFRRDFPAEVMANEQPLGHQLYGFAGTLDRVLRPKGEKKILICDLKSSVVPQVKWQLGAYSLLWRVNNGNCITDAAVAVELRDNASYQCTWLDKATLRRSENEFLALLTVYNAARREKITLPGERDDPLQSSTA